MRSLEELKAIKEKAEKTISVRENTGAPTITVAMGTCGISNGAREVLNAVIEELNTRGLANIHVTQTGCPGLCHKEPIVTITVPGKNPYMYGKVTPENVKKIIVQHIVNNQPVTEWLVNLEE
ncbi:MAG: NAD(P)-dependent iron-only hydrogenase iron-sulfur protein [Peptococcaceae bacterium]|jgi:(2Fe-2S) ferredoxin|nr:NAD(P)-dependent iron-only hydrogenase iron-sulfur protein [Peptococcaceae bacterium]